MVFGLTGMTRWHVRFGALLVAAALSSAVPTAADTRVGAKNQPGLYSNQISILEGRAAEQYSGSSRLRPDSEQIIPRYVGTYRGPLLTQARAAARRNGVPEDLFLRLIEQESAWNAGAISIKGAIGLAQ